MTTNPDQKNRADLAASQSAFDTAQHSFLSLLGSAFAGAICF
jgi:hypothetical protein